MNRSRPLTRFLGPALLAGLVLGAALFAGGAQAGAAVERIGGTDRYDTAAALSRARFQPGVPRVFLATGADFGDALAAAPAAVRLGPAPVLLTTRDVLPEATRSELERLGPQEVVVLGGTEAVSEAVARAAAAMSRSGTPTRIRGADRYATAAAVADAAFTAANTVYVASGVGFADALPAGALGAATAGPVLLATRDDLPQSTVDAIGRLRPGTVIVVGGASSIGASVEQRLASLAPTVARIAGADRYDTAAGLSRTAYRDGARTAYLASGETAFDALAAGAHAGTAGSPLLLTSRDCLPPVTRQELDRLGVESVVVVGGTTAIGTPVEQLSVCAPPRPTTTTTTSTTTSQPQAGSGCHPSYPDFCIPAPPPDLDCADLNPERFPGAHENFTVVGDDPHRFDGDHDGFGCERSIGR